MKTNELKCVCGQQMTQAAVGSLPTWNCRACGYTAVEYNIGSGAYGWHAPEAKTDNASKSHVSSAVPYLRFQLKLYFNTKETSVLLISKNTGKQRRLHHMMTSCEWNYAELTVRYSADDPTLRNDALCDSPDELRQAITAFTEPELLDYVRGGKWGKE